MHRYQHHYQHRRAAIFGFAALTLLSLIAPQAAAQDVTFVPDELPLGSPEIVSPARGLYRWRGQEILDTSVLATPFWFHSLTPTGTTWASYNFAKPGDWNYLTSFNLSLSDYKDRFDVPGPFASYDIYERYDWSDLEVLKTRSELGGTTPDANNPAHYKYDFAKIDADIAEARRRGGKLGFAFRSMVEGEIDPIPRYLKNRIGGVTNVSNSNGTQKLTYCPNWRHAEYRARARALFAALGAKYNGSKDIAYLDIRMYGLWGEWHFSGMSTAIRLGDNDADNAIRREIVDWHTDNFDRTQILSMTEDDVALEYALRKGPHIGWRRDSLGDSPSNDGYQIGSYGLATGSRKWHYSRQLGHFAKLSMQYPFWDTLMKDRWKTAPVVTETMYWTQGFLSDDGKSEGMGFGLARSQKGVKAFHVSLVCNGHSKDSKDSIGELTATERTDFAQLGKLAGYRYVIESVRLPGRLMSGKTFAVTADWINRGYAPVYEPWTAYYQLRDGAGNVAWSGESKISLKSVLPEDEELHTSNGNLDTHDGDPDNDPVTTFQDNFTLPSSLASGTYTLSVQVRATGDHRPFPLPLAIRGMRYDGSYALGTVQVVPSGQPIYRTPSGDGYIRGGSFAGQNYGSANPLFLKGAEEDEYRRQAYLLFDLVPVNRTSVSEAKLRLYVTDIEGGGSARMEVKRVDSDTWSESSLTWNQRPTYGATFGSTTVGQPGFVYIDVTAEVNAQLAGNGRVAFAVLDTGTGVNKFVQFASREETANPDRRPTLVLTP
ncbi:MAG: DNRLRE domain-containing protein [Fibrella sp.]|nr:DNRLRE domain-containing protein [Armatimonadota bacterium]